MKIAMFFLILLGMTVGAMAQDQVSISDFQGKYIKGVKVSGAFQVKIRQGEKTGAKLSIPACWQKQLVFRLGDNGVLEIGFTGRIDGHKKNEHFMAEIECSTLEEVVLSGACRLEGESDFNTPRLSVKLSGATGITMGGRILARNEVKLDFSGASKFNANIQAATLDVELSGASTVVLRGKVERAEVEMSGASKVTMDECVAGSMSLSVSGASNAKVNVTGQLDVSGSGASKIGYYGTPQLNLNTSGATSVSQIR